MSSFEAVTKIDDRSRDEGPKRAPNFDPAFRPAVAEGHLTVQQAVQRGNRKAFATRLTRKYGISMQQALKVADNRLRLGDVVKRTDPGRSAPTPERRRTGRQPVSSTATTKPSRKRRALPIAITVVSLLGVGGASFWGISRWNLQREETRTIAARAEMSTRRSLAANADEAGVPTAPPRPTVDVEKNHMGMLARIAGPDPQSVLNAYCGAIPGLQPLGLLEAAPPFSGSRLGIFRDVNSNVEQSILIRRDFNTGRWRAGDGTNPIMPQARRPVRPTEEPSR